MDEKISKNLFDLALNLRLGGNPSGISRQIENLANQVKWQEVRLEKAESVCFFISDSKDLLKGTMGDVLKTSLRQWKEERDKSKD